MPMTRRGLRKTPYTERGISRVPCSRCSAPSVFQWQVCADNRVFRGVCRRCDVALNSMVLRFMRDPERKEKITKYVVAMSNCDA